MKADKECNGEHHTWYYYIVLPIAHVYFLLEFVLRACVQKYQSKFLMTLDSFLEIMTTVPYLLSFISFGDSSFILQFFIMFDQARLFLYNRYTKNIQNEVSKEQIQISLNVFFITWVMSFFTQFVENHYDYNHGFFTLMKSFHDTFFFMMTTISTVGYGSTIISPIGRISIIFFIAIVVVIVPDQCSRLVVLINSKSVYARH